MSMLDSFFSRGFKAAKCKTLLKLTTPRIKLLRNRREVHIKQMRRDIAKLLETGQEATARIRVEHIVREENMMAAQEILELFCELIAVRLPIIEAQRECPLDLKEAISSVCFAAPRCADLPELQQVQLLFVSKYGKEFVAAATELRPDCGVNRELVELLSVRAPSPETKLKLLKDIAEEHELDWDPAATESEFFKSHEDLLDGPKQFVSGSKLPLPKERHDEASYSAHDSDANEKPDSDTDFDPLDFPEVPNVSLPPNHTVASIPEVTAPPAFPAHPETEHESSKHTGSSEYFLQDSHFPEAPNVSLHPNPNAASTPAVTAPPAVPPQPDTEHESSKHTGSSEYFSQDSHFSEVPNVLLQPNPNAASMPLPPHPETEHESSKRTGSFGNFSLDSHFQSEHTSQEKSAATRDEIPGKVNGTKEDKQFSPVISPPSVVFESFSAKESKSSPVLLRAKTDADVDFQDVLAAAQAAADTAERAAAAARSAASLAQVRIAELTRKSGNQVPESITDNPFHTVASEEVFNEEKPHFDHQNSSGDSDHLSEYASSYGADGGYQGSELPDINSFERLKLGLDPPVSTEHLHDPDHHRPQRLPSMDDEPYFSYPNLFTSQNPNPTGVGSHSFTDNSKSAHDP